MTDVEFASCPRCHKTARLLDWGLDDSMKAGYLEVQCEDCGRVVKEFPCGTSEEVSE